MKLESRIKAFAQLGSFLSQFTEAGVEDQSDLFASDQHFERMQEAIQLAHVHNPWFSKTNVLYSLQSWSDLLTEAQLSSWLNPYKICSAGSKTVAIVMAGNIPLVGFHDFLCVLITGHRALIKQSSNDQVLLGVICAYLMEIEPGFKAQIEFTDERLSGFDAVIATGSNNTARYFEYYFGKYPSIIRKNRNSVAVLKGNETEEELEALSEDIFRYYGLGCRNVSKLYVPQTYDFDRFFKAIYKWHPIIHEHKYANNYDYNKAVYLMSEFDLLDNGFLVLKEDPLLASPIATLNYEYYNTISDLKSTLEQQKQDIQCVVSNGFLEDEVKFGETQKPGLDSYADQIDTVEFLLTI
jgi:hypothetical protein